MKHLAIYSAMSTAFATEF